MTLKINFSKWVFLFAIIGFLVPFVYVLRYLVFGATTGTLISVLWPGSAMFMGLDTPNPGPFAIFAVYAFAWGSNIFVYALIGAITWPPVQLVVRK
jgi:hypothetical protein